MRKYSYLHRYGITKEIYDQMFESQNGLCAICRKPERLFDKRAGRVKLLAVDHSHKTGKVRGLLCQACNTAIGLLTESKEIATALIEYLEKNND